MVVASDSSASLRGTKQGVASLSSPFLGPSAWTSFDYYPNMIKYIGERARNLLEVPLKSSQSFLFPTPFIYLPPICVDNVVKYVVRWFEGNFDPNVLVVSMLR